MLIGVFQVASLMGLAVPTMYSIICETGETIAMTVLNSVCPKAPRHNAFLVVTLRGLALIRTHCHWPLACHYSQCLHILDKYPNRKPSAKIELGRG